MDYKNFLFIFLALFQIFHCQSTETYNNSNKLQVANVDDQFILYWKKLNDEILIEVHVKTTGWVGVGISPNGGMRGADIAIGWVDDKGTGYLRDCYATGNQAPVVDDGQPDWILVNSSKKDGTTMLKMKRKLQTCNVRDQEITEGPLNMIFAWNNVAPDPTRNNWSYHGNNRLRKTVTLLQKGEAKQSQPCESSAASSITIPYSIVGMVLLREAFKILFN